MASFFLALALVGWGLTYLYMRWKMRSAVLAVNLATAVLDWQNKIISELRMKKNNGNVVPFRGKNNGV